MWSKITPWLFWTAEKIIWTADFLAALITIALTITLVGGLIAGLVWGILQLGSYLGV